MYILRFLAGKRALYSKIFLYVGQMESSKVRNATITSFATLSNASKRKIDLGEPKSDRGREIEVRPSRLYSVIGTVSLSLLMFIRWFLGIFLLGPTQQLNRTFDRKIPSKNSASNQESKPKTMRGFILDDVASCDKLLQSYRSQYPLKLNFLGIDCEWVNIKHQKNSPVALLQIATPLSDCFLIRLCKMDGQMPESVRDILEDKTILKFGVGIMDDAKRLSGMCGIDVSGCVDLRHVIQRCREENIVQSRNQKMSLDALAKRVLGVTMDKYWRICCSNWEADEFERRQIEYAMNDAMVGSHIFLRLVKSKLDARKMVRSVVTPAGEPINVKKSLSTHSGSVLHEESISMVGNQENYSQMQCCDSRMCDHVEQKLKEYNNGFIFDSEELDVLTFTADLKKLESEHDDDKGYLCQEGVLSLLQDSVFCQRASSLCQGVVDVSFKNVESITDKDKSKKQENVTEMHNRKPYKRGTIRKSPLYMNCMLAAPDGSRLCTLDRKKADWYIEKGIGKLTNLDPYTVQLNFEPSGRPGSEDSYYLNFKDNICVVCGSDKSYLRKNIVPHDYRRYFPLVLKDHHSHDVLLMCSECHRLSAFHDDKLRKELERKYNAPLGNASVARLVEDPDLKKVKSAAKALNYAGQNLPSARHEQLTCIVQEHFKTSSLTPEMIQEAATMETRKENSNYVSHGQEVVKKIREEGKLLEFEKMWRQHFLDTMRPRHLPPLWSVDHRHDSLKEKIEDLNDS